MIQIEFNMILVVEKREGKKISGKKKKGGKKKIGSTSTAGRKKA